jgi:dipicolinate synthase subunit A
MVPLKPLRIYFSGDSPAVRFAKQYAAGLGCQPVEAIEAADAVLLPVPTPNYICQEIKHTGAVIYGGNLPQMYGVKQRDLLQDEYYLGKNAAITAHCALSLATEKLLCILPEAPVLILGWGRIAQCLAHLCKGLGGDVTIYARKETDRAMAEALGMKAVTASLLQGKLGHFRVLFNTIPAPVLTTDRCRDDCIKIDLASERGITGDNILWARGLPGKMAPESSGKLMVQSLLRLQEQEV